MNYWIVPIIIRKRERFWEIAGALFFYLLSEYGSWIGDQGTAGDALIMKRIHFKSKRDLFSDFQIYLFSCEGNTAQVTHRYL